MRGTCTTQGGYRGHSPSQQQQLLLQALQHEAWGQQQQLVQQRKP